jgi:hypothetical protein
MEKQGDQIVEPPWKRTRVFSAPVLLVLVVSSLLAVCSWCRPMSASSNLEVEYD